MFWQLAEGSGERLISLDQAEEGVGGEGGGQEQKEEDAGNMQGRQGARGTTPLRVHLRTFKPFPR